MVPFPAPLRILISTFVITTFAVTSDYWRGRTLRGTSEIHKLSRLSVVNIEGSIKHGPFMCVFSKVFYGFIARMDDAPYFQHLPKLYRNFFAFFGGKRGIMKCDRGGVDFTGVFVTILFKIPFRLS